MFMKEALARLIKSRFRLNMVALIIATLILTCVPALLPVHNMTLEWAQAAEFGFQEAQFLTLINNYRQQHGLQPLALSPTLTIASRRHSEDMATWNYFSHGSLDGGAPWNRIWNAGYAFDTALGENIAAGYATADQVFEGWKNSPDHNANMLFLDFAAIGIGLDFKPYSRYGWYWTTDFGGYDDSNVTHPNGTLIKGLGPVTYIIDSGKKRYIPSKEIFNSYKFRWQDIVLVSSTKLASYLDDERPLGFRDGALIKGQTLPDVYVVSDGFKCRIKDESVFTALGYQWSNVISVPKTQINYNTSGSTISSADAHPEGTLVKGSGSTVYLIDNQERRPITSPQAFESRYNWHEIVQEAPGDVKSFSINENSPVSFRDGLLIKSATSSAVYVIVDGQRRRISSSQVFAMLGYKWENIRAISTDYALNKYSNGSVLGFRDGMLIRGQGRSETYVIEDGLKRHIKTGDIFNALGYKWENIVVVPASQLDYDAKGADVISDTTHPNGTLLKTDSSGVIYLIQNGQRRKIHCWNVFLSHKFRYQDVVVVPDSRLSQYSEDIDNPLGFRDGMLIKEKGTNKIYVISNGKRRCITNTQVFEDLGYKWASVKEYAASELSANPVGSDVSSNDVYLDGTLIKGTKPTVYLTQGLEKKPIPSSEAFLSRYEWSQVVDINGYEVSLFPLGIPLTLDDL